MFFEIVLVYFVLLSKVTTTFTLDETSVRDACSHLPLKGSTKYQRHTDTKFNIAFLHLRRWMLIIISDKRRSQAISNGSNFARKSNILRYTGNNAPESRTKQTCCGFISSHSLYWFSFSPTYCFVVV